MSDRTATRIRVFAFLDTVYDFAEQFVAEVELSKNEAIARGLRLKAVAEQMQAPLNDLAADENVQTAVSLVKGLKHSSRRKVAESAPRDDSGRFRKASGL